MDNKLTCLVALCLLVATAMAEQRPGYPGGAVDARTMRHQAKAEELFEASDYERALFIYRNELAPIGDKYAQYMVGYMHLNGMGVGEDAVAASAWYRLAAERRTPEFITVRDELMGLLDPVESGRSDRLYLDLRRRYADLALVVRLLRRDFERLDEGTTGSRVGSTSSPVQMIDPLYGRSVSNEAYYQQLRRRMQVRLDFVTASLGRDPMDADLDKDDIEDLEREVMRHLATIDDR